MYFKERGEGGGGWRGVRDRLHRRTLAANTAQHGSKLERLQADGQLPRPAKRGPKIWAGQSQSGAAEANRE